MRVRGNRHCSFSFSFSAELEIFEKKSPPKFSVLTNKELPARIHSIFAFETTLLTDRKQRPMSIHTLFCLNHNAAPTNRKNRRFSPCYETLERRKMMVADVTGLPSAWFDLTDCDTGNPPIDSKGGGQEFDNTT